MFTNRSIPHNLSRIVLTGLAGLILLTIAMLAARGAITALPGNPVAGLGVAAVSSASRPEESAYAARMNGLAELYRAQRAQAAEAARWAGLAQTYLTPGSASDSQQADVALAARYTALAIQEYVRTHNHDLLPKCVTSEIMALLPGIGDGTWRVEAAMCSR